MTSKTSTGLAVIQRVSTLKGIMQVKKKTTTVISIVTTCFLERRIDALSVAAAATTYNIKCYFDRCNLTSFFTREINSRPRIFKSTKKSICFSNYPGILVNVIR